MIILCYTIVDIYISINCWHLFILIFTICRCSYILSCKRHCLRNLSTMVDNNCIPNFHASCGYCYHVMSGCAYARPVHVCVEKYFAGYSLICVWNDLTILLKVFCLERQQEDIDFFFFSWWKREYFFSLNSFNIVAVACKVHLISWLYYYFYRIQIFSLRL